MAATQEISEFEKSLVEFFESAAKGLGSVILFFFCSE